MVSVATAADADNEYNRYAGRRTPMLTKRHIQTRYSLRERTCTRERARRAGEARTDETRRTAAHIERRFSFPRAFVLRPGSV